MPTIRGSLAAAGEGGSVAVSTGAAGGSLSAIPASSASIACGMSKRPPLAVIPSRAGTGSTPASSASLTSVTVAVGASENSRPAAPVTCGAAIEVPCRNS